MKTPRENILQFIACLSAACLVAGGCEKVAAGYCADGQVYLLNAEPGRYVAVAAAIRTTRALAPPPAGIEPPLNQPAPRGIQAIGMGWSRDRVAEHQPRSIV